MPTKILHPKLGDLANEFTSTFAMFEYAMKEHGFYDVHPHKATIDASWHKFATAHSNIDNNLFANFRARLDTKYIIDEPPKIRAIVDQRDGRGPRPGWQAPKPVTNMEELWFAVKRTRNNLFHGDKTAWMQTRDPKLLNSSLAILDELLEKAPNLRISFEIGVALFDIQT